VYSEQCSETVIGVFTVYSAVILSLVCVQCTVQNETVIGVCTVYSTVRLIGVCTV